MRLLLVEGNDTTRLALAVYLELAGFTVTQAADGATALRLLHAQHEGPPPFAVVVTDIRLPSYDGIQVFQAARALAVPAEVVVTASSVDVPGLLAALRAGVCEYLEKPCPTATVVAAAQTAATKYATPYVGFQDGAIHLPTLHVGTLQLGPTRQDVVLAGQPLALTWKEYKLLRALAARPGEIRTYQELAWVTHACSVQPLTARHLIWPHAANLRKKLPHGHIENCRNVGYRLGAPEG